MANIGQQLLTPEVGWKRIDDTDSHFRYIGTGWVTSTNSQLYNGNEHATNRLGDTVNFKFYGTKLRLLSGKFTNNPDNININIDGTSYKYNQSGTSDYRAQIILFEKLNMDLDVHTITITNPSNDLYMALDCIDIDEDGYLINPPIAIGDQLLTPQSGYKRIDDVTLIQKSIITGSWNNISNNSFYNKTVTTTAEYGATMTFYIKSKNFRFISRKDRDRSDDSKIICDGIPYTVNLKDEGGSPYIALLFEKVFDDNSIHKIVFQSGTNNSLPFLVDAIDIDEDGYVVAKIGNSLPTPEPGWKRINDNDKLIKYGVGWGVGLSHTSCYNNTFSQCQGSNSENSKVTMYLCSDKLRIIGLNYASYSNNISVTINNTDIEKFSSQGNSTYQALLYDKKFKSKYNKVELQMKDVTALGYVIECIDIDKDGYLITEEEYSILTSKKYLIKENTTYKTIVNDELAVVEDAATEFNKQYPDNKCITNLNEVIKFIPQLTKGWKIISNENFNSLVTAIETNKQLVIANGDFSIKLANNIDYFKSTSTVTNTSSIKIVLSTDSGLNWFTTNDNGTSWIKISCVPPLKKYNELSSEEITAWNNFKDEVLSNGINIKDLNNIDFNTLKCETIRFAYVLNTNAADDVNIIKSLEWQFDSIGSYDQMNKDSVKISITNNSIKITPLKNVELMKVNVGISSNEQQELDTSGLLDKKTFLGNEINSVKKADIATSIDVSNQLNGSMLYYGTDNNDSEMKMRQFPAGTHTEHIDTYSFDNLTKDVPQSINFVKEIPNVNCFVEALKYVSGKNNVNSIFEKYTNNNITKKTINSYCDEKGINIKDIHTIKSIESNNYFTNNLKNFTSIDYICDTNLSTITDSNNYSRVVPNSYTVTASSSWSSDYLPNYAFDGIYDSHYWSTASNKVSNEYIQIKLDKKYKIDSFSISAPQASLNSAPRYFELYGSNNGINFTKVYTSEANLSWSSGETRYFDLNESVAYNYYKLLIISNNGEYYIGIGEFSLCTNIAKRMKYLLEKDGSYYTFNKTNKELIKVEDLSYLNSEIENNYYIYDLNTVIQYLKDYSIYSNKSYKIKVDGLTSSLELIVSQQNLLISSAEQINSFSQNISKTNNGNCKTVFSLDNGLTWKTWDIESSQFVSLTSTISSSIDPINMTLEQKTEWDTFKNEIDTKGISSDTIATLNFNSLFTNDKKTIKFAHVLIRPTYEDNIVLQNMSWNINEKGRYYPMNKEELLIGINSDSCEVIALKEDIQNVKVNILI